MTATSREHIDFIVGLLIIIRWHLTAGRKRKFTKRERLYHPRERGYEDEPDKKDKEKEMILKMCSAVRGWYL